MRQQNGTAAAPPSEDSMAQALEEYLEAAEAGTAPPREQFLARYPELAEYLDGCLAALRFIGQAAEGPRSVAAEVAGVDAPEQAPGRLGDFRLIREVGRGGMGVVYEAEQVSLGRRVALKVLPFAATLDPRQLQRFHNEARAAASLDHPHIVHVHAVGCERAVHFYAMQFIEGQTLAAVIADLRRAGGRPARPEAQPTTPHVPGQPAPADTAPRAAASTERGPRDRAYFRRVAEWGIQAAEALDHAHALGIVHRDVKPANLMVDAAGRLWVTDFGLAHVRSDAHLTMTGDLVGTLRYMSPEQALAKRVVVDHRTDVYSLGATLYELLTLEPAYAGNDRQELLRQIAFEEPKAPRRVNKAIPAELETITLKALEKNPADRYATAKDLAADLRHFQADEPIRARRAGVVRRLRKWGRRHPAWVTAAAAALTAALAVLSGGMGWVANDRATRRQATATAVAAALDESLAWQERRRLPEALAAARRASGLAAEGPADDTVRRQADARLTDLRLLERLDNARLEPASGSSPGPEGGHFDHTLADRLYRDAFRRVALDVEGLPAPDAGDRLRGTTVAAELAAALDDWAYVRLAIHGADDPGWRHLFRVARAADPDAWRVRVREALERRDRQELLELATSDDVFRLLPPTLRCLASALRNEGARGQAVALLRETQRRHPGDFWANEDLGLLLKSSQPPQLEAAIRFYTAAAAVNPLSPGAHVNLGNALRAKGQIDEAIAEYREAIQLKEDHASAHFGLGDALRAKGDMDGAVVEYRAAIRINSNYAAPHTNLGVVLKDKGDVDGAIAEFEESIRINKGHAGTHNALGLALRDKGDAAGAAEAFRAAIQIKGDYSDAHTNLGNILRAQGDLDGAIAAHRAALSAQSDSATAHNNLGVALLASGDTSSAAAEFREALRYNPNFVPALAMLGQVLREQGQFAEALTLLRRGHDLGSKGSHRTHPPAQAVKQCERLIELDGKLPAILSGKEQPANDRERGEYAAVCQKKCLYASAARLYREAITAKPDLVASPDNDLRYNAACAAALAGCGAGEDAAKLTDAQRAGLRQQALDWLRADLDAWTRLLNKDPDKVRPAVAEKMRHWLRDPDFAGVRGPDTLAKLPEAERKEWQDLWADIAETLRRAADKPPQPRDGQKRP